MDRSERDALSTRGLFAVPLHFVALSLCRLGNSQERLQLAPQPTRTRNTALGNFSSKRGLTDRFDGGRAFGDNPFSPSATIPFSDNPHARQDGGVGPGGTTGNSP